MTAKAAAAAATVALLLTSNFLSLAGFRAAAAASANEGASSLSQQDVAASKLAEKCPQHALKMAFCFKALGGLINGHFGKLPEQPTECCSLMGGMIDFEMAMCLCTAVKLNLMGMNLKFPIVLSVLKNFCGTKPPTDFQCF